MKIQINNNSQMNYKNNLRQTKAQSTLTKNYQKIMIKDLFLQFSHKIIKNLN